LTRLAAIAAFVVFASPLPVVAASFTLTERQAQDAIEVGERSITQDTVGTEWRVRHGTGPVVTVMTPFHRLAVAARHAAFRKEPLTPRDQSRLLREQQDRLVLWVELRGPREDFARFFTPRLLVGARQLEPSFAQNERTASRAEDGAYVAHCVYGFPTRMLGDTGKVVLVVHDGDGRDVASIPIDLSTMR
jgi:hypothetical protein